MTIQELCQSVKMVKKVLAVRKRQRRNSHFLHLVKQSQVFKLLRETGALHSSCPTNKAITK
jgi:hypothetical protein